MSYRRSDEPTPADRLAVDSVEDTTRKYPPQRLTQFGGGWNGILLLLYNVILLICPITFMVLGYYARSLDQKTVESSPFGLRIVAATKYVFHRKWR
jgi:hypothetical protein